jgi:hypothetical protein
MPHSIGVGATLVALNREAEASPTQFFPASVRHYEKAIFRLQIWVESVNYNTFFGRKEKNTI